MARHLENRHERPWKRRPDGWMEDDDLLGEDLSREQDLRAKLQKDPCTTVREINSTQEIEDLWCKEPRSMIMEIEILWAGRGYRVGYPQRGVDPMGQGDYGGIKEKKRARYDMGRDQSK